LQLAFRMFHSKFTREGVAQRFVSLHLLNHMKDEGCWLTMRPQDDRQTNTSRSRDQNQRATSRIARVYPAAIFAIAILRLYVID
jgi:hypothetical protein